MSSSSIPDILVSAYRYLSYRPRTEKEIRSHLSKKLSLHDWSPDDVEQAIELLREENHINDLAFIDWYVTARSARKFKSVFAIKGELRRMGLSDDLIAEYFSSQSVDEHEQATQLLQKKWHLYQNEEPGKRQQKVYRYLASRGYSSDVIRHALARIEEAM
jgi:regulatory protein